MIKPSLLVAAGIVAYLAISQPDRLVVGAEGDIKGITNQARAAIQQGRFWRQQRAIASQRAEWIEQDLEARGDPAAHLDAAIQEALERAEQIRQDYPDMNHPQARESAELLSSMADAIMESHWEAEWTAWDREDLAAARAALHHIEQRL